MRRWLSALAALVLGAVILSTPGVVSADDGAPRPEQTTTAPIRESGALSGMTGVATR